MKSSQVQISNEEEGFSCNDKEYWKNFCKPDKLYKAQDGDLNISSSSDEDSANIYEQDEFQQTLDKCQLTLGTDDGTRSKYTLFTAHHDDICICDLTQVEYNLEEMASLSFFTMIYNCFKR
jgi:hypothetical protein